MLRPERFFAVVARRLFGSRVIRSLNEVKPNDASGLAAIGAVVLSDLLEVVSRKRGVRRVRRRKNGRRRRSGGSARTGSQLGRRRILRSIIHGERSSIGGALGVCMRLHHGRELQSGAGGRGSEFIRDDL